MPFNGTHFIYDKSNQKGLIYLNLSIENTS